MSSEDQSVRRAIKERRRVEFIAKHLWRFYRPFVRTHLLPRCNNCALSVAAGAELNKQQLCQYCTDLTEHSAKPTELTREQETALTNELHELLVNASSTTHSDYDALVFFSGGKDSTYILYRLAQDYPKLRLLAVTVDNGFMSPIAKSNIIYTVKKMGLTHRMITPAPDLYTKLFAYALTHPSSNGTAETIDVVDGELRFDMGRHLAAQLKIPLVIIGLTRDQMTTYGGKLAFQTDREHELQKRTKVGPFRLSELPLTESESNEWWDGTQYNPEDVAKIIYPLVVWNESQDTISHTVIEQDLIQEGHHSPLLTNHLLIPLMALVDTAQLGYASWEPEFAKMIRNGKADKQYWQSIFEMIKYAAKTGRFIGSSTDSLLERLRLKRSDVNLQ